MNRSKIVLITGATSGIGKETALLLTKKGFTVYGTARNVEGKNLPFKLLPMDVRNQESISQAVKTILAETGKIDILINNAGVGITGAVEEIPMEELQNVFATNFYGAISLMQAVLPSMREQKSGLIINVTSIAGYMGLPFRGAYSASKGALMLMSEALRMEVKNFGIEIATVAPGDYATDIASRRYHAPVKENSAYAEIYQKSLDLMNQHVDSGGNPIEMAEKIFQIICTKHPNVHYKQGSFLQKFSIVLKRILPSKTYEKMLMNHYKM
ncbi:short-chain dehydrogenase/reductase [Capnocytophaga stomatis]|uniref:Short-chain dehydrogenase/reductase n=1 Tax=Capnocytophaga stomatis TaxID=1848904 RepID=A0A250G069_9FLAO|nr:SDR family oxidoreductase [Capnocytophaga stomatis]ATA89646.1 short-chain dehydrogenase/reductase [Capnocytophaga stomatis]